MRFKLISMLFALCIATIGQAHAEDDVLTIAYNVNLPSWDPTPKSEIRE